jgi:hypothetical protein
MGLLSNLFGNNKSEPKITVTLSDNIEVDTPNTDKRVFSDNDPSLMESIQSDDNQRPTQKLPFSKTCPYCGVVQDKPIGRKKTCPDCKKIIFVRTAQDLFPSSALTKEQVAHVAFYTALKFTLMATKDDFDKHEKALQKKWNAQKVNTYDVLWSMYNDTALLKRNIDKSADEKWGIIQLLRNHQMTTFDAAKYQAARGHNPTSYLKMAHSYSLQMAKLQGEVKGLIVQCYSCCDTCTKFHDKTFSLDFIAKTPVLPVKTCTRPFEDGSKFAFCTCSYRDYYEWQ